MDMGIRRMAAAVAGVLVVARVLAWLMVKMKSAVPSEATPVATTTNVVAVNVGQV